MHDLNILDSIDNPVISQQDTKKGAVPHSQEVAKPLALLLLAESSEVEQARHELFMVNSRHDCGQNLCQKNKPCQVKCVCATPYAYILKR